MKSSSLLTDGALAKWEASLQEAQIEEAPEEGRRKTEIWHIFEAMVKNIFLPAPIESRRD